MAHKNRPQYVKEFVKKTNEYLRHNKVKDEFKNDLFCFACQYLLDKKMYEGFNFYKEKYSYMKDGKEVYLNEPMLVLAGTSDKNQFDCLQLY